MSFHSKMIKLRKYKGFTQETFAAEIGVSRQSVYKWESGQSYPEVEKLLKVARTFGVTVDDMLNDEMEVGKDGTMLTLEEYRAEQEMLEREAEKKRARREAARLKREAKKAEQAMAEPKEEKQEQAPVAETVEEPIKEEPVKTEEKVEEKAKPSTLPEKEPQKEEKKKRGGFFGLFRRK